MLLKKSERDTCVIDKSQMKNVWDNSMRLTFGKPILHDELNKLIEEYNQGNVDKEADYSGRFCFSSSS